MKPLILFKTGIPPFSIALLIVCLGLSPKVQAVSPAPDGDYPGGNTAEGQQALLSLSGGTYNTAVGFISLKSNIAGNFNTGLGAATLLANTGYQNTATGAGALLSNTTGFRNTANGAFALFKNLGAADNTATGNAALFANTTGGDNTANGNDALYSNTIGAHNTANGGQTLDSNTTGNANTADGFGALRSNINGSDNTASGYFALHNNNGNNNIALGFLAGGNLTTGVSNIDIGNNGIAGESSTIRIGTNGFQTRASIAGIRVATVTGTAVVVNASGQLGVAPSSQRFKDEIKPMDKASEAIHALKPVTFRYKQELDPKGIPQFGLVAEEVDKVNPDLVVRDKEGKPYSVRYDQVNAMLLNEFLKEHCKVEELQAGFAQQQKDFKAIVGYQQKQIEALTAGLHKVSTQIEMSRVARQMVVNNQ